MNPDLNKISTDNYVSYENPELYIHMIYNQVIISILNRINNFMYDEDEDETNAYIQESKENIEKWSIFKKFQEKKQLTEKNQKYVKN